MTRRKNTPKRLKSEDEDESGDESQEAGSTTSDLANGDQDLEEEAGPESSIGMDTSQSQDDPATEAESETLMDTNSKGGEEDGSHKRETDQLYDHRSDRSLNVKEEATIRPNYMYSDVAENEKEVGNQSECDYTPVSSSDSEHKSKLVDTKPLLSEYVSKEPNQSLSQEHECVSTGERSRKAEESAKKLLQEHFKREPNVSKTDSSKSSSSLFSSSGSNETESPISKLLSMVNNPEKIHRSGYSNAFSLAATPSTKATSLTSKTSYPSTNRPLSSPGIGSGLAKNAKPLSGFLPPYNVFSQFQSMYAQMSKYLEHSKEDISHSHSKRRKSFPSLISPQSNSSLSSSPVTTTEYNQDQPLDLSVKTTGLDLSKKSSSDDESKTPKWEAHSPKNLYIPRDNKTGASSSAESSLKSLEEKFGGNSFKMEPKVNKGPKPYIPFVHPMLPMYGGTLYASALFNTHPWMQTEKLARVSDKAPPSPRKTPNNTTTQSNSSSVSQRISPSSKDSDATLTDSKNNPKLSPTSLMAKMTEKELFYHKKYTNLKCNCKKEFETLYDLTMHVKETGHTPSSRIAEHHEFPKLVRGQDMWLNHGSEQTKQILRCIRCGESFKSLPDLTVHMMKTKHYTNIVGSEAASRKMPPRLAFPSPLDIETYRCFECSEPFTGMDQFSKHLVSSGHHKSPIVIQPMSPERSSPDSESALYDVTGSRAGKRSRTVSESSDSHRLNLAKLLDYRDFRLRYEQALKKNGMFELDDSSMDSFSNENENKIRCETCSEKIEMSKFVEHVRQCIKDTSLEYSEQPKKRRLELDKYDKSGSELDYVSKSARDHLVNGRDSLASPLSNSYTTEAFLQPNPEEQTDSSSALKAMESFIERSFTSGSSLRNSRYSGSHSSRPASSFPGFPFQKQTYLNGTSPKSPRLSSPPTRFTSDQNLYTKYLPPLYVHPTESDKDSEPIKATVVKSEKATEEPIETILSKSFKGVKPTPVSSENRCESPGSVDLDTTKSESQPNPSDTVIEPQVKSERDSRTEDRISPDTLALHHKYLSYNEPIRNHINSPPIEKPSQPSPPPVSNAGGSALASLQGLVYGKSFDPLDSIQKMIGGRSKAQAIAANGSRGTSPHETAAGAAPVISTVSGASLASAAAAGSEASPVPASSRSVSPLFVLPLKNPLGILASNNNISAPNSPQLKKEPSVSPSQGSTHSEPRSPIASETDSKSATAPLKELEKVTAVNGDYRLPICRAPLIERIKERKTNSSMSRLKSSHESGKLKKAPYVYLPLDHSAKFNKYYEMANELASKTK